VSGYGVRVLTVRQPYAWAIIHGGKGVENRTRNIAGGYRGPVAIHAGLRDDPDAWADLTAGWSLAPGTPRPPVSSLLRDVVRGAVIGVVDLVEVHDDCVERDIRRLARLYREDPAAVTSLPDDGAGGLIGRARTCSPWALPDQHHLILSAPRALPEPIPARGRLGLWRPDDALAAAIRDQLAEVAA